MLALKSSHATLTTIMIMAGTKMYNSLNILSWNIASITFNGGSKLEDKDTEDLITSCDIVCLQEVWRQTPVANFKCCFSLRNPSNSGGVAILIKNNLAQGLSIINTTNPDIIVAKLDSDFFKLEQDTYIINAYARPENSAGNSIKPGIETIQDCYDVVCNLPTEALIYFCGDVNARIGTELGQTFELDNNYVPVPPDYEPDSILPRTSQDKEINKHGRAFLEFVSNNQLIILNGRTLGDLTGAYTSIQRFGCSVVDYVATSRELYRHVEHMKVGNLLPTSDHRPIHTKIKCSFHSKPIGIMSKRYEKAPGRFIITTTGKEQFRNLQQESAVALGDMAKQLTNQMDPTRTFKEFENHLRNLSNICFKTSKPNSSNNRKSSPWFNHNIKTARKLLKRATDLTNSFPTEEKIKSLYYRVKGRYKKMIRNSKARYISNINRDIEDGKVVNWEAFKKVKNCSSPKEQFNAVDMNNFESFFKELYSDTHTTLSPEDKERMLRDADDTNTRNTKTIEHDEAALALNLDISRAEISTCIRALKCGKAAGDDMISNDILKTLDDNHVDTLTNILNHCFSTGNYPWNNSIITPLHKKGPRGNPDNYRAVSVGSAIGKLFSSVMLDRLCKFREMRCPDPINQLGFRKGAQTSDHLLTLMTLAQKYRTAKKPLFATFVDFRKAFDSVPRQALFQKLAKLGICGNYFNVLRNMYSNSSAQLKLSGHLSRKFKILKGTEQGHPMSPELFKIYLLELSGILNTGNDKEVPHLGPTPVSHLLWADDLILLSLSKKTAQDQVRKLHNYCNDWGLEVNTSKTKLIIFNNKGNMVVKLQLGQDVIQQVDKYCYLGLQVSANGDFSKIASEELTTKAFRAMYSLRSSIRREQISFKAAMTLFNALVKPVALYGAPIWIPQSSDTRTTIKSLGKEDPTLIRKLTGSRINRLHLSYLKWTVGVHRKTSNAAIYGDTGTRPMSMDALIDTVKYVQRISKAPDSPSLVHYALQEQRTRDLPWYKALKPLLEKDPIYHLDHVSAHKALSDPNWTPPQTPTQQPLSNNHPRSPTEVYPIKSQKFRNHIISEHVRSTFNRSWATSTRNSSKLSFYIRGDDQDVPTMRQYLELNNFNYRSAVAKFRCSAHPLNIETGRYKNTPREKRLCPWCEQQGILTVETEEHALDHCGMHDSSRQELMKDPQFLLMSHHSLTNIFLNLHIYTPRIAGLMACFVHAIITTREKFG